MGFVKRIKSKKGIAVSTLMAVILAVAFLILLVFIIGFLKTKGLNVIGGLRGLFR
jgi:hypothetical protein